MGNTFEIEGVSFYNMVNVAFKETLIQDYTKVTDVCGSRNSGAIDAEGEVMAGSVEGFGA